MNVGRTHDNMATSARFFLARGMNSTFANSTMAGSPVIYQTGATNVSAMNAATQRLISNLVFAESKSIRTSTIILATFNVLAALTTALSILYDCYWASKMYSPKSKASKFCISSIHPAETFPLLISIGIVVQGITFAIVQSHGLKALTTNGCGTIAQFMWPALFLVPYIQLVFGLECALRSLRRLPFQARGKYDVTICCVVVLVMLIVTWIPSHIYPQSNICFASLVWFVSRYGELGFILLASATGIMILSALTIFYRLSTVNLVDQHQRIAASRMVYYLVVGVVSLGFVVPYFFSLIYRSGNIKLAMMATVVLNLSGLMTGVLQLFLRSNTATTSFGPKSGRSRDNGKHDIRIFGPNELALQIQMTNPVTGPRTSQALKDRGFNRMSSRTGLISPDKETADSPISLQSPLSPEQYEAFRTMPTTPDRTATAKAAFPQRNYALRPSYSLFPTEPTTPKPQQQTNPVQIYGDDLELPPPIHPARGIRHKRESSVMTSATVQIGFRISHASTRPSPSSADMKSLPHPPSTNTTDLKASSVASSSFLPSTTSSIKSPSQMPSPTPSPTPSLLPLPSTTYSNKPSTVTPASMSSPPTLQPATYIVKKVPSARPGFPSSPLRVNTSFESPTSAPPPSPKNQSPTTSSASMNSESPMRTATINRSLPSTPKAFLPLKDDSEVQLSPAVYTPEKKLPPAIAAISRGPQSATLPKRNPLGANPLGSPLARSNSGAELSRSGRTRSPSNATKKTDWI